MTEDYNYSNKLVVFILSTFDVFSFDEYTYGYKLLREYIIKNDISDELVDEFLECLFSISLNEAYLTYQDVQSSNSYLTPYQHAKLIKFFYDDFKEEIEKAKLFIIWYVNNSDRFKISKLCNYKSIVFEPTAFEQSFLANATVGLKRDNVTTVAKVYKTFLQTQNCKYYETFWIKSTEPNLSRMFEDYKEVFDTSCFKSHIRGNKYVIKLPDVDKFTCAKNLTINDIFEVLFNLWQIYCSIKKDFYAWIKNDNLKKEYLRIVGPTKESCVSFKLLEMCGSMTSALNFLKEFNESPFTSKFEYLINEVKYIDNPMGNTDSISKISERSEGADAFIKEHYKSVYFNDSEISMIKSFYARKTKNSKLYKNYLNKYSKDIKSPFPEFFYDRDNLYYERNKEDFLIYDPQVIEKKLIKFWINEHGLYMLYVFILSKIFDLSLPENQVFHDKFKSSKKKKSFERDIDMRFNFDYLSQLSHICSLIKSDS